MMKKLVIVVGLFYAVSIAARFHALSSEQEFEKQMGNYPINLACLIQSKDDDGAVDKTVRKQNAELKDAVRGASRSLEYDGLLKRDVGFLVVDVSGRNAQEIQQTVGARDIPMCALFEEGKKIASLPVDAHTSRLTFIQFIEQHVRATLEKILRERKEQAALDQQERIARYRAYHWYPGYGPYWTYYGPNGWYGYGPYGYPYGGFGVQFVHHSHR